MVKSRQAPGLRCAMDGAFFFHCGRWSLSWCGRRVATNSVVSFLRLQSLKNIKLFEATQAAHQELDIAVLRRKYHLSVFEVLMF